MLKIRSKLADALPATSVHDSKVISSSSENNRKLAKSDFIKPMHRVEEFSSLTSNARQVFI